MFCPKCGEKFRWHVMVCPTCDVDTVDRLEGPEPTPDAELACVFITGDPSLIPIAKSLLEEETIEYLVRGESIQDLLGAGRIGGFNYAAGPVEFWVRSDQAEQARGLLTELSQTTSGDTGPNVVADDRDDDGTEGELGTAAAQRQAADDEDGEDVSGTNGLSRRVLFGELGLVLWILWVPLVASSLLYRAARPPTSFALEVYWLTIDAGAICLLLYLVWRNGESLQVLGLRPTKWWVELSWAVVIYFAVVIARSVVYATAAGLVLSEPSPVPAGAAEWADSTMLPFRLLVGVGFEEVLFRGYVWNRLEQLTRRSVVAVLVSALLFASYHSYSSVQVTDAFVGGVLFGVFYGMGRSVPRLVLAHFAVNLATYY